MDPIVITFQTLSGRGSGRRSFRDDRGFCSRPYHPRGWACQTEFDHGL